MQSKNFKIYFGKNSVHYTEKYINIVGRGVRFYNRETEGK